MIFFGGNKSIDIAIFLSFDAAVSTTGIKNVAQTSAEAKVRNERNCVLFVFLDLSYYTH